METKNFTLTIRGKSKTVEAREIHEGQFYTIEDIGAYKKYNGKTWHHRIMFTVKDNEITIWKNAVILNRNGYQLIGWAEDYPTTVKHNALYNPNRDNK